mmetsp:Transcript_2326/g.4876  ORF Transcript_2326/g.4876 Transcript_2326/m.4876 type:complete len:469 (+) Transcript_2326:61-1467(+)
MSLGFEVGSSTGTFADELGVDGAVERLTENFRRLDNNSDGTLDLSELANLLRQGSPEMSNRHVRLLFTAVDKDSNGRIEFKEFLDFLYAGTRVGTSTSRALIVNDPLEWRTSNVVAKARARSASSAGAAGTRPSSKRNSLAQLRPSSSGGDIRRRTSSDIRRRTSSASTSHRPVVPAAAREVNGLVDEALSLLFEALDVDTHGALSYDQVCEARRLLAPLAVGGDARTRVVRQAPMSRALPASFKNWAKDYLGVFDCPSDEPLARRVMNLALCLKPPFMPINNEGDARNEITSVLHPDSVGKIFVAGHHSEHVTIEALQARGITHTVGIGMECSGGKPYRELEANRHHMPLEHGSLVASALEAGLEDAVQFIKTAITAKGHILVYCDEGVSWSPAVVIAYLVACRRVTLRGAFEFLKRKRPCVWPSPDIMEVLINWETSQKSGRAATMRLVQYKLWTAQGSALDTPIA